MSTKTETLTIRVAETIEYLHTFTVTADLLDEAAARGYERDSAGVLYMIEADPDHEIVANDATVPKNFQGVTERDTQGA